MSLREKLESEIKRRCDDLALRRVPTECIVDALDVLKECTCRTCADWTPPDHPRDQWGTKRWGRCNGQFDEDSEKPEDHGCYAWRSK